MKGKLQFVLVRDVLSELKREFRKGNNESTKFTELKMVEQREKTRKVFVQEFRRAVKRVDIKKEYW